MGVVDCRRVIRRQWLRRCDQLFCYGRFFEERFRGGSCIDISLLFDASGRPAIFQERRRRASGIMLSGVDAPEVGAVELEHLGLSIDRIQEFSSIGVVRFIAEREESSTEGLKRCDSVRP